MRAYSYVAFTKSGARKSGTLVAESERSASDKLKAQGLFPEKLTAQAARQKSPARRLRLDPDTRTVFTRQMAVLLGSDLPVEAALDAVIAAAGSARLQAFVTRVKAALMDGHPLSRSIENAGGGFARYYSSAIRAGESSGDLAPVFDQLADYLESSGATRSALVTALVYPAFVTAVSLAASAILITTVAPEIVAMFEVTGQQLPRLTTVVLGIADWIALNWIGLLVGLAAAAAGFVLVLRTPATRDRWDRAMLRLPVAGRQMRLSASAQYLRTLALVLGSRQTAVDAVASAAEVLTVQRFRDEAAEVIAAVKSGESLSKSLTRLSPLPPVTLQLLSVGEDSARLPKMADRSALLVETWIRDETKRLAAILDPLLMMLVGILVLTIVLAILLPIFDLQTAVS